ncbi:MAG: AMP-binding protein [Acidimicrobiales bacterium]
MIELARRTVADVLLTGAATRPDRIAIIDDVERVDYRGLLDLARRVAGGLRRLGIGRGNTVALVLDNSVDHVLAWFGASLLRAVEVAINTTFGPPHLAYTIDHCDATVVVVDEWYVERLRAVADQLPKVKTVVVRGDPGVAAGLPFEVLSWEVLASQEPVDPEACSPSDPLGIVYTSGTTSMPKGVVVSQAQTHGRMWPLGPATAGPEDVTLVTLPLYHVIGQCRGLYNTLIAGGTAVLVRRFSASNFWDECRKHGVTYAPLVGAMAQYLLRQPPRPDDADNPVRHVALGTTIPEVDELRRRFDIERVSVSYGLTEAGGILVGEARADGCGHLRPDFEARLVDEDDVEVPYGDVGEFVLRPTEPWTTMIGYFKMPEETAARWRNLWLHTGDLMAREPDGTFRFVGRGAERIRVRGENVAPSEVEAQLGAHPDIEECAAVGVSVVGAAAGDQEILLAVVVDEHATLTNEQLITYLEERLPRFAVPRYIAFMAALPRTEATARVQRSRIADEALAGAWDRLAVAGPSPVSEWRRSEVAG